jgi:RNA polymerase sigma-70 factor (ECF subfamily)
VNSAAAGAPGKRLQVVLMASPLRAWTPPSPASSCSGGGGDLFRHCRDAAPPRFGAPAPAATRSLALGVLHFVSAILVRPSPASAPPVGRRRRMCAAAGGEFPMPHRNRTQLERMERAIAALPEPTRTVYRLHLFAGLDYLEIGAALGLSSAAVERHVAEAIVLIDRALRRSGD